MYTKLFGRKSYTVLPGIRILYVHSSCQAADINLASSRVDPLWIPWPIKGMFVPIPYTGHMFGDLVSQIRMASTVTGVLSRVSTEPATYE